MHISGRFVRSGFLAAALSISGVLVAYASLPPQAGDGPHLDTSRIFTT
jgi:hypothetical protein